VFRFILEYNSLRDFGPKAIVFRFIIEYNSLRDFIQGFLKHDNLACIET
jgi:hypothetical protein